MKQVTNSGYFYANKFALIMLKALEEVVGKNGLNAILNLANLSHLIDHYPEDNLELEFDFGNVSAIYQALEDLYGPRGGRGLSLRAGRATFNAFKNFGALAGTNAPDFKALPVQAKLRIGLPVMAKIFSTVSDQVCTVEEHGDRYLYTIHRCPDCWGRSGLDRPVCFGMAGLLEEGVKWLSGNAGFHVLEEKCLAVGDQVCEFVIQKTPID